MIGRGIGIPFRHGTGGGTSIPPEIKKSIIAWYSPYKQKLTNYDVIEAYIEDFTKWAYRNTRGVAKITNNTIVITNVVETNNIVEDDNKPYSDLTIRVTGVTENKYLIVRQGRGKPETYIKKDGVYTFKDNNLYFGFGVSVIGECNITITQLPTSILKDFSGNKHDAYLYGFKGKLNSGVGIYAQDFKNWSYGSTINKDISTKSYNKFHIVKKKADNWFGFTIGIPKNNYYNQSYKLKFNINKKIDDIKFNVVSTGKNLITESILIKGYNTVNGSLSVNEEYNTTQLIDIKDAKTVFTNAYSVALFTSDGSYIGYTGNQTDSFRELKINQSPAYRYAVFNFNKNTHAFVSLHYFPCNPNSIDMDSTMNHDEILRMAFSGKKMTSFGDSIVELASWQKYVWKYFNMADHYNRGIGGSKVTSVGYKNKLVDEYGYYHASNPSEGTISIKDYMCGDERVSTIPLDTDILIIYASANDISSSVELGSIDDGDETHFYYAYALMIRKIIKRIPNAKIFVCTPHNFYNKYEDADYPYKNNQNLTILDYCKVIKDIAAIYGIPVIDVNGLSGISTLTITKDLGDQVHPNNIGGQKIANVIINTLIRFAPIGLQEPRVEDIFH